MNWWHPNSPVCESDGIIADGSIRAGKTFPMSISFIEWAFFYFEDEAFAICGKTVGSVRRNILFWLLPLLKKRGYAVVEKRSGSENYFDATKNGKTNRFYIFGGRDESSQDLIQGLTLAGVLLDEVALMPESFVNQATGRCSVEGAKFWFNCNPGSPSHWFKTKWLDIHREKNLLHLHFVMTDNPSLTDRTRKRYQSMYSGVFFKRFILGLWVMAEGAIYDMFCDANQYDAIPLDEHTWLNAMHYINVDYGTQNACVFQHMIDDGENLWIEEEYYYSGRDAGAQKTDSQYADDLEAFIGQKPVSFVIVDPSAASFKAELRNRGIITKDADNDVLDGIRLTSTLLSLNILRINRRCKNTIREIQSYVWDPKPTERGKEQPLKRDDHGPDALRYGVKTIFKEWRLAA
jgi:PBSX family phage terminase large subunit